MKIIKTICKRLKKAYRVLRSDDCSPLFDEDIYWQRHSRYNGWTLGNSSTSMQEYGCALMCWSYAAKLDPKDVDQLFIDEGVYNYDLIDFQKACDVLGFKDYEKSTDINRMPTQEITIKEVLLGTGQHFVIRINKNGNREIFDPWNGSREEINYYQFVSYRIFNQ
jgi:hypothetical protein